MTENTRDTKPAITPWRPIAGFFVLVALLWPGLGATDEDDESNWRALTPTSSRFQGEELYYSLDFFGSELARGAMVMGEETAREDGTSVIEIYGLALTDGVAQMIYPLRDEGTTYISPTTGLPIDSVKTLEERGEYRHYDVDFNREEYHAMVVRDTGEEMSRYLRSLPSTTYDAFSWFYAMRDQPLEVGTTAIYYIYDGWKLSRLIATIQPELDHILVGDERVECREISLYREVMESSRPIPGVQRVELPPALWPAETSQSGEQVGSMWVSNDDRRLPVSISFENDIITVFARLSRFTPPADGY
ncbi:MAG: DUF3108 domain-containing protein [Myxococcales bacterium]|nr:DUF3108 domain-containing protein [Myxococcales bacterium]